MCVCVVAATMGVPPVHAAIKSDDSEALSGLMARGGAKAANTPNAKNQAPLHWAANLQKLDAVRALLLVGAEVCFECQACSSSHTDIVYVCAGRSA